MKSVQIIMCMLSQGPKVLSHITNRPLHVLYTIWLSYCPPPLWLAGHFCSLSQFFSTKLHPFLRNPSFILSLNFCLKEKFFGVLRSMKQGRGERGRKTCQIFRSRIQTNPECDGETHQTLHYALMHTSWNT